MAKNVVANNATAKSRFINFDNFSLSLCALRTFFDTKINIIFNFKSFPLIYLTKRVVFARLACKIPAAEKVFSKKYPIARVKLKKTAIFAPLETDPNVEMIAMNTYHSPYCGTLRGMMTMGMMCMRSRFRRV